jgi:hypothetical protein
MMIGRSLLAAALLVAFSAPAFAFHCPADVKAIDNAVPKSNLTAAQKTEVMKLRDEGEAQHNAGKHQDAVNTLAKAMRIILNSM